MFSFGGTAPALGTPSTQAPTSTASSFNFGGMSTGQPVAQSVQPAQQSSLQSVSSFSTHPFQYIQQCYDQNSLNYRFRVPLCILNIYGVIILLLDLFLQRCWWWNCKVPNEQACQHLWPALDPDPQWQSWSPKVPLYLINLEYFNLLGWSRLLPMALKI